MDLPNHYFEADSRLGTDFLVHQNASRVSLNEDHTTQSVTAGQDALPLHRERSYLPGAPELLFFFCAVPAESGSETTVCDGVRLLRALPGKDRKALEAARVTWSTRINIDYMAWTWDLPSPTSRDDVARAIAACLKKSPVTKR